MLIERALVVVSRGDRATVKTHRGEACSSCLASGACKALGGGKEMEVEVLNHLRAKAGDMVELALPEPSLLKACLVTYGIPLVGLAGGAAVGFLLAGRMGWSADLASVALAFAGLGLTIPLVWILNRRLVTRDNYIPRIVRILPPSEIAAWAAPDGSLAGHF